MAYDFVEGMREISGFGGGYEDACRRMVKAGCEWVDAHPNADPKFRGFKNVMGLIFEDNEDAKELSKTILQTVNGDATGAMMEATINHILYIKCHGWKKYVEEMSKKEEK